MLDLNPLATVTAAYLSNTKRDISPEDIPGVIAQCAKGLIAVNDPDSATTSAIKPIMPWKKSITPQALICLFDGKKLKMLKRYLRSHWTPTGQPGNGMTPDDYRRLFGLPADYPMVASEYAARRSDFAKSIGLGRTKPAAPKKAGKR